MVLSNVSRPEELESSQCSMNCWRRSRYSATWSRVSRRSSLTRKNVLNYLGMHRRLLHTLCIDAKPHIMNICFDSTRHEWLLHELNILPFLLLPLAGPEEFSDEDNDMFPTELQYLDSDKTRESDPDLRKILLESLAQLCATRKARDYLRSKGTYEILRELHKFECSELGDRNFLLACENVVDILIRTEEEIGEDNLKELTIPTEYAEKFDHEL